MNYIKFLNLLIEPILSFLIYFYIMYIKTYIIKQARIAQLVEQWIEDPRVTSSNLVLGNPI
jgi:hypothetical protein